MTVDRLRKLAAIARGKVEDGRDIALDRKLIAGKLTAACDRAQR